jgi:glucose/arabinose dehydrogenase
MKLLVAALLLFLGSDKVGDVLTGDAAFQDYTTIRTGQFRKITVADLPKPFATASAGNGPEIVPRPANAWPQAPAGFQVQLYADGLNNPREIRTAPNGDLFVAESGPGDVRVYSGITADGKPKQTSVFLTGLKQPFGMAFAPAGLNPRWLYIGNTDSLVRVPYITGDLKARGPIEKLADLPRAGYHWTRDLALSPDGNHLFVSVGSNSNINDPDTHSSEFHRADILVYSLDGQFERVYASGTRNPVGIAVNPETGELWCSTNERDELGDNLPPDYITHVADGGFYGWPYYYIGGHPDPRLGGKHPELKDKVLVPDVLLQPHNASLELTFYEGRQFPAEYKGDIFAAEHGSWNRHMRTGYEVIRVPLENGHSNGVFENFLTGFVTADGNVWGRPVGVAVAKDGSLMVTDDGSNSIWRVLWTGGH